ncbi:MAG: hypothetical protein ACLPR9_20225 [Acidimicrobiales bacterium]
MIAAIAVSKKSGPSTTPTSAPAAANTSPTSASAQAAAQAFLVAFNNLNTASNADSAQLNANMQSANPEPVAATATINSWIASSQTFDRAMGSIQFPSALQSDVQQVMSASAAFQSGLQQLGANTDNISNYNSALSSLTPLKANLVAATSVLGEALGLTKATTSP